MNITKDASPLFSIIIPMYNRARFIGRALESCLNQDFRNFEVIVVDDGSTDGSPEVVEAYNDPRIILLRHPVNRGHGPSRNLGGDSACGEWLVFLDSDDELLPGALSIMEQRCREMSEEIASLRFMCRSDTGDLSPDPPLQDEVWGYEQFLQACESRIKGRSEALPIVRRRTFRQVRFPEDRSTEGPFHLDLSRLFSIRACPDVVRLYHHDADNQITRPSISLLLLRARDMSRSMQAMMERHGEAMRLWAPKLYWSYLSGLVTVHFLAGHRLQGWRAALKCLQYKPASAKIWAMLLLGSLGRRPLAWVKTRRGHGRIRRHWIRK